MTRRWALRGLTWLPPWWHSGWGKTEVPDETLEQLVKGVGQVCISASSLEWALTYLVGLIENWDDAKHRQVLRTGGRSLEEFCSLASRLEAFGLGAEVTVLADDARRLLRSRHRIVHSVMMIETKAGDEDRYEAWHAMSDTVWPLVPKDLYDLAFELADCTADVMGLAAAWQERAEHDGWPVVP